MNPSRMFTHSAPSRVCCCGGSSRSRACGAGSEAAVLPLACRVFSLFPSSDTFFSVAVLAARSRFFVMAKAHQVFAVWLVLVKRRFCPRRASTTLKSARYGRSFGVSERLQLLSVDATFNVHEVYWLHFDNSRGRGDGAFEVNNVCDNFLLLESLVAHLVNRVGPDINVYCIAFLQILQVEPFMEWVNRGGGVQSYMAAWA